MKKIGTILFAALLGSAVYGQDATNTANVKSATEFQAGKKSGTYAFELPATVTTETVKKSASYYTQFFTVDFNEKTRKAVITMIQNDEQAKHVIVRFMISNGINSISMNGTVYTVDDFWKKHIL